MNIKHSHAFTIVELLVVIVVIGILASITTVAYSSISRRAIVASLQSDLANASRQLKIFAATNGTYPTTIIDCPSPAARNLCLRPVIMQAILHFRPMLVVFR